MSKSESVGRGKIGLRDATETTETAIRGEDDEAQSNSAELSHAKSATAT